ncbi:hypothetical protein GmHk_08G023250 [Glycine max]|nr:hypothetical protein GmHk_08G023250 [Glycine max]
MYDSIMSEEVDMNEQNEDEADVNEEHVHCSDVFNTSQVFATRDDILLWARSVADKIGFVEVIMRSYTNIGIRGMTSFFLIGCERSAQYWSRKKDFVRRDTGNRKCGCPFKLQWKLVVGGQGWMVKLMSGSHNHKMTKSLVGYQYVGRLTKEEKIIITDMTKSMDEDVVCNIFRCHHDVVKLCNACILVFLIDSTYKINRYMLPLLDLVCVTPTGMTFFASLAYLEEERLNNMVWALERFRGFFLRRDSLPRVIVTNRDLTFMNAVKTIFPECTNLLCRFHIDKNVKAKCKSLIGKTNAWDYVMDAWGSLVDCYSERQFYDCLKKFEIAYSPWPMFVDYVNQTSIIPHKEKFVKVRTNKVMHLGNTTTNRVESAHWALKRLLQNSLGDLCSVWKVMNNMITLQHTEIKAPFETSTHVVGHLPYTRNYMFSRYALNHIVTEFERVHHAGKNPSRCGCVMRTTHSLPFACELSKYVVGTIPLETIHMFWWRLSFSDQGLSEPQVTITEQMEIISKRFEELYVCGKEIAYPDLNSMCPPPEKVNIKVILQSNLVHHLLTRQFEERLCQCWDQFHLFIHNSIENIVDVKADGDCGYHTIVALLGMDEDSWLLVRNHLLNELGKWSNEYINLLGGIDRFEELKRPLHVDGLSMVTMDKWMDITDMGYFIASRYNVILVSLSRQQSMTFFPLRSQPPTDSSVHRVICISHVIGNHFIQVYLRDRYPLPPLALLWSRNCHSQAKQKCGCPFKLHAKPELGGEG